MNCGYTNLAFKLQSVELSQQRANASELDRELGIYPTLLYNKALLRMSFKLLNLNSI